MSPIPAAPPRGRDPPVQLAPHEVFALAFGRTTRVLRARQQISQETLGERASIHRNHVGAIERGESNPRLVTVARLVTAFDVSLPEIWNVFTTCHREVRRDITAGRVGVLGRAAA